MKNENNLNKGISCNVKGCVFNEHGNGCNLDKVSISKGEGRQHFCKSYIPFEDENEYDFTLKNQLNTFQDSEASKEYFNFDELMEDIEEKIDN